MDDAAERLEATRERIRAAERAAGRAAGAVTLIAVSKTFAAERVRALAACGQLDFGENYVDEAEAKLDACADLGLRWHFIGPLQSNKTRRVAARFDWVHSLDRDKLARRLSDQRPDHRPPLDVCVQVNVSGEASKSGVAPDQAAELCARVAELPRLRLRGLMAIPDPGRPAAPQYANLAALMAALRDGGLPVDALSAGMSGDFADAIAHGATHVRIGSALFGARPGPH